MFVIDDSNHFDHCDQKDPRCGARPRVVACGQSPYAPRSSAAVIPMEEWPDRIADAERNKTFARYVWEDSPIGVLNQGNLGYCHAFSVAVAIMIKRAAQGQRYAELSASSVGAPVTGYQNQGAVITDDLKQVVDVGIATTEFVPMATTRRGDFRTGWEADAAKHRAILFEELEPRNFLEHVSALLCGQTVQVALNYWGHAVTDVRAIDLNPRLAANNPNRYGIEFLNSWSDQWGDRGFGVRAQSRALADQAYVLRQIVAG